jgi:hypothetical protein
MLCGGWLEPRIAPTALVGAVLRPDDPLPDPEPSPGEDPGSSAPITPPPLAPSGPIGPGVC